MSSTNPAHVVTRIFPAFLFLLLFSSIAFAHREDYIDETLVFATLDRGEIESQYWFDAGSEDSDRFTRHHIVFEYGITDHWMIDGRVSGLDEDGFHLDSSRFETRYRFFGEGILPIDIAVSGEVNTNRDAQGHQIVGIEPRLILSKDFGKLNLTTNLAEAFPFTRRSPSLEVRGGWQYDATKFFRFGAELRYDTEEHSVAVIPQIWLVFPHEVTFKAGYFYDFGGTHERFVRVALVKGFRAISTTLQIALLALVPVCMLFAGSAVIFSSAKTVASFLQLFGAGCLVIVVLAHLSEALHPFPSMNWGRPHSIGHYLDFWGAVLGLTLFPLGYLFNALTNRF